MINLKALNSFVQPQHFKMEGIHTLKDHVSPGDWLANVTVRHTRQEFPVLRGTGYPYKILQVGTHLVGHPHDKMEWEIPFQQGSGSGNRFRCISDRMGCSVPEPTDWRSVVSGRVQVVHKLQPWYTLLLRMLVTFPYLITHTQPMLSRDPLDLVPQLAVWHISGEIPRPGAFGGSYLSHA